MPNTREIAKRSRLSKIKAILESAKKQKLVIEKDRLIAMMIVEHGISRKTAIEEVEAVILYNNKDELSKT